ncbi:discoidin domain-containing protein [Luteolibacter sp. GHJ8]|uniref:Discoidin domain-containing protein n=1 Tax=Luteolibacter rhizosphaerae TaxID=2989719 RepID=A0ABT3FXS2_9BACT|nr:discoidin domain-containing protein [Luteolibacter rhizosphaerae]MCW1912381.1 discoidin domain-containing protein [Luteolibacter rhizosphaerae]
MKEDRLDLLLHALFEGSLGEAERGELNDLLRSSSENRTRYRRAAALHSALIRKAAAPSYFEAAAPQKKPLPFYRRHRLAAVAVLTLTAALATFFISRPRGPIANVVDAQGVAWSEGSPTPSSGRLPVAVPVEFRRGFIKLGFPSGASVVLEGPCRFRLDEKEALSVSHGRVSVHTPDGAEGFRIDTPGGRFVDLGTEFGLAVGSDGAAPVVLTEVFKGEVEVQTTQQAPTRLGVGESRALVRESGRPKLLAALDESPVMLVNHTRISPGTQQEEGNLALGKPVFSPGYCTRPHGSIFPPDNLTDGRLNDSGVPGDWSFWLAPDGENGEFTVDLLEESTVGSVALQNTNNRDIDDRGTAVFEVFGSLDNKSFFPLTEGELPRIAVKRGEEFPFHRFTFGPQQLRYVKVVVSSHYAHPKRKPDHPCQGGGLNEIQIFEQ